MDTDSGADDDTGLEAQAIAWLVRLTSGEAGPDVLADFERWRNADPQHEVALTSARHLWLQLGRPLESQYARPWVVEPERRPISSKRKRSRMRPTLAAAAAVLAVTVGLGQRWLTSWQYDQVTAIGEQRTVALADGSTLWLNTGSAANLDVDNMRRHIQLLRGEAFFEVQRDPQHPFSVDAGGGQVKVLGTAFGVRRDGEDVIVTVQRGRVQVSGGGTPPVTITPDQQVRVHLGDRIKRVELVNADQNLSWRTGRLVFEDRTLSEILNELERYDRRMILVRYSDASRVRINAIVDLARLDEWYDGLQQSLPVEVIRIGPVVWVSGTAEASQARNESVPTVRTNAAKA